MSTVIQLVQSRLCIVAVLVVMAAAMVSAPVAAAGTQDQARNFVRGLADNAVAALTQPGTPDAQREARIRQLLTDYFAVDAIGQWVLGRYWASATPEQREQYLKLFRDMIVVTYRDKFKRYSGETLEISDVVAEGDGDAIVQTEIGRPGAGDPINVGWRVRAAAGRMQIVDVIVEGVSMSQTQRSEFGSVISRGGGDVSVLLEQMRRVIGQRS